jgi:hypothetical protein
MVWGTDNNIGGTRNMDSKEFGPVFARQLAGIEDLHYGY